MKDMAHKYSNLSTQGVDQRRAGKRGRVRSVTLPPEERARIEREAAVHAIALKNAIAWQP